MAANFTPHFKPVASCFFSLDECYHSPLFAHYFLQAAPTRRRYPLLRQPRPTYRASRHFLLRQRQRSFQQRQRSFQQRQRSLQHRQRSFQHHQQQFDRVVRDPNALNPSK